MTESATRNKLLDAAARLFHEQGYAATGISTILREAGVNSGSLYYFFPTKEALLHGVLARYMDLLDPVVMEPAFARTADPLERIFAVLAGYREMLVSTGCGLGCPIGNLALELSDTHPEVRRQLADLFEAWCERIRRCLDALAPRLPAHVDRASLARFVLTVMEGGLMQARARRTLEVFDEAVAHLRAYLEGLLRERT